MCKCWVYHIKIFGVRNEEILKSIQKILTDERHRYHVACFA